MDDLISRQAAIKAIDEIESEVVDGCGYQYEKWRQHFCELPSAEPERKKGKWNTDKESPEYATCSVCGHCDWDCTESEYFNYCPHCGADMRQDDPSHPFADSVMMNGEDDE